MNNKGQVLMMFLLILPVVLMILAIAIDTGMLMVRTYKVKQSVKEAIEYFYKVEDIDKTKLLLSKNIDDSFEIINDGKLKIKVKGSYNSIFKNVFTKSKYNYEFVYSGYMLNDELIIDKE